MNKKHEIKIEPCKNMQCSYQITDECGLIAYINFNQHHDMEPTAKVLRAAPELLAACKNLVASLDSCDFLLLNKNNEKANVDFMREAITKAEGK